MTAPSKTSTAAQRAMICSILQSSFQVMISPAKSRKLIQLVLKYVQVKRIEPPLQLLNTDAAAISPKKPSKYHEAVSRNARRNPPLRSSPRIAGKAAKYSK